MNDKQGKKKTQHPDRAKEPDFEGALLELEGLVGRLEKGELSLDESLQQFKRGVELARRCQQILDQAQQVVEQLSKEEDESSSIPTEPSE
jgi:exodeoxyribonuclease VII small subunit